jgi:hypothetical protein
MSDTGFSVKFKLPKSSSPRGPRAVDTPEVQKSSDPNAAAPLPEVAPLKPAPQPSAGTSRVARMLALGYRIEQMIDHGGLKDYAAAASRLGVTRARLTQVMGLLGLAPQLQEQILLGKLRIAERQLRGVLRTPVWSQQVSAVDCMTIPRPTRTRTASAPTNR